MKRLKRILAVVMTGIITVTAVAAQGLTASAAGEYKAWMQGDTRWKYKQLGRSGSTMSSIGCVVTSLSMLIVKAGCADEYSFNPGVLCDYLSQNGGFDSTGGIYWNAPTGLVKNFSYVSGGVLSGNQASKANQIANYINQGYYVLVAVNYGGHWVAVDGVNGSNVNMMDPAKKSTSLFDAYNSSSVTQIRVFKKAGSTATTQPAVTTTPTPAPVTTIVTTPAPITEAPVTTEATTTEAPVTTEATDTEAPVVNTEAPVTTSESTTETTAVTSKYSIGTYYLLDDMNIRKGPDTTYDKIGLATGVLKVPVIETSGDWGKIILNGKIGWINLEYSEKVSDVPNYPTGLYATNANLNYREDAGINFDSYGIMPNGTTLTVIEVKDGWGKVSYKGITGWCSMEFLTYYEANTNTAIKMANKQIYSTESNLLNIGREVGEYVGITKAYSRLEDLIVVKA